MSRCICLMVVVLLAIAGTVVSQQETPSPIDVCEPDWIGDSVCDPVTNNREECEYDDGDCCECTCESDTPGPTSCVAFDCLDPEAECFGDTLSPSVTVGVTPRPTTDDDDSSAPLVVFSPRAATIILGLAALFAILIPLR